MMLRRELALLYRSGRFVCRPSLSLYRKRRSPLIRIFLSAWNDLVPANRRAQMVHARLHPRQEGGIEATSFCSTPMAGLRSIRNCVSAAPRQLFLAATSARADDLLYQLRVAAPGSVHKSIERALASSVRTIKVGTGVTPTRKCCRLPFRGRWRRALSAKPTRAVFVATDSRESAMEPGAACRLVETVLRLVKSLAAGASRHGSLVTRGRWS